MLSTNSQNPEAIRTQHEDSLAQYHESPLEGQRNPFRRENGEEGSAAVVLAAVLAGGAVMLAASNWDKLKALTAPIGTLMDGLTKGGESDQAPRGPMSAKEHVPQTASDKFLTQIGTGIARVAVKAKQDYDKPGGFISGDVVPTNGTASVADPDDREQPALLELKTRYCADGMITRTDIIENADGKKTVTKKIKFEMGKITVCGVDWLPSEANEKAFDQGKTKRKFNGPFESFVKNAAIVTGEAVCPQKELEASYINNPDYLTVTAMNLAKRHDIPITDVEVIAGSVGRTDEVTKKNLKAAIDSYTNKTDPKTGKSYPALTFVLPHGGESIEESCFTDQSGVKLSDLHSLVAPDPSRL